jgi:hypothetical protein
MSAEADEPAPFVAFIAAWKAIGLTSAICLLAVLPLLPGMRNGLVYTAFFYSRWGYPFLVAACAVLFFLAAAIVPLILLALLRRPAIEISAGSVRIWGLKWRAYPLNSASKASSQFGSLLVRNPDGKQFTIPLWVYRDPGEVLAHLEACGLRAR